MLLLDRIQLLVTHKMRLLEILNEGSIQIEDKNICDFKILKNIIFETHLQNLKDVTVEKIYENLELNN